MHLYDILPAISSRNVRDFLCPESVNPVHEVVLEAWSLWPKLSIEKYRRSTAK